MSESAALCAKYCEAAIRIMLCAFLGGAIGGPGAVATYALAVSLRHDRKLPAWSFVVAFVIMGAAVGGATAGVLAFYEPDLEFERVLGLSVTLALVVPAAAAGVSFIAIRKSLTTLTSAQIEEELSVSQIIETDVNRGRSNRT